MPRVRKERSVDVQGLSTDAEQLIKAPRYTLFCNRDQVSKIIATDIRACAKAHNRRWLKFATMFQQLDQCHPEAAAILYIVPERGAPRTLLTQSMIDFQSTSGFSDLQINIQRFQATRQSQTPTSNSATFTSETRRDTNSDLSVILRGGRAVDLLRRLIADIKRYFPGCQIPSSGALNMDGLVAVLQDLARPGVEPPALSIWHTLCPTLEARHGNGAELLMVIRVLDWIALQKGESQLPCHPLETQTAPNIETTEANLFEEDLLDDMEMISPWHSVEPQTVYDQVGITYTLILVQAQQINIMDQMLANNHCYSDIDTVGSLDDLSHSSEVRESSDTLISTDIPTGSARTSTTNTTPTNTTPTNTTATAKIKQTVAKRKKIGRSTNAAKVLPILH